MKMNGSEYKMATTLENNHWDTLIDVIQRSYKIKKHVDFFRWQQDDLAKIFPHDVLIAVWGDFNKGTLNYDVSSNIPGIRTQSLRESSGHIDHLMSDLYQRWLGTELTISLLTQMQMVCQLFLTTSFLSLTHF